MEAGDSAELLKEFNFMKTIFRQNSWKALFNKKFVESQVDIDVADSQILRENGILKTFNTGTSSEDFCFEKSSNANLLRTLFFKKNPNSLVGNPEK
jgi:hypothetical protein